MRTFSQNSFLTPIALLFQIIDKSETNPLPSPINNLYLRQPPRYGIRLLKSVAPTTWTQPLDVAARIRLHSTSDQIKFI